QAEDGIRDLTVTGVQTCALPILVDDRAGRIRRRVGVEGDPLTDHRGLRRDLEGRRRSREDVLESADVALCGTAVVAVEDAGVARSEERRVGKECRGRWPPCRVKR